MKLVDYVFSVAPRAVAYAAVRHGLLAPINPLTLTFSVTAACQSRCRTCNIGNVYLDNPKIAKNNLSLEEVEKVFKSLGRVYFFNVSGGEPFMRRELPEIIRLACMHLRPRLLHIPTNGISPKQIKKATLQILDYMDEHLPPSVPITIKPSIDGVGALHDYVRGYPGNFEKLEQTIDALLEIRAWRPRLHVDLGTVISNYNLHHLDEIEDWVHRRGVESYRHEIAEQRAEFHNLGDPITPAADVYEQLIERFKAKIVQNVKKKAKLTRVTEAVRMIYYDVAVQILKERRQVTPCYAGISNIHMNYDGEVWPCCVLGGTQPLGRVRDMGYDMQALLRSAEAAAARQYIKDGRCACPLANQWLNNVLLTPRHMLKVLYTLGVRFNLPERFPPARTSAAPERKIAQPPSAPVGSPLPVQVKIVGNKQRRALVMHQFGTIPLEAEVELPELEVR